MERSTHQGWAESPQGFPSHRELRTAISRSLLEPGSIQVLTGPVGAGSGSVVDALPSSVASSMGQSESKTAERRRAVGFRYRQFDQPTVLAALFSGEAEQNRFGWETLDGAMAKLDVKEPQILVSRLQRRLSSPLSWRKAGEDLHDRAEHFMFVIEGAFCGQADNASTGVDSAEHGLPDGAASAGDLHDDLWQNILALAQDLHWSILIVDRRTDSYYSPPTPPVELAKESPIVYYRMGLLSQDEAVDLVRERLVDHGRYPEQVARVKPELAIGIVDLFGRYYGFLDGALSLIRKRLQRNSEVLRAHSSDGELLESLLVRIRKLQNEPELIALPRRIYRDLSELEKNYMSALAVAERYPLQWDDVFEGWAGEDRDQFDSLERRITTNLEVYRLLIEERAGRKSNASPHFQGYVLNQEEARVISKESDLPRVDVLDFDQRTFLNQWLWGGLGFLLLLLIYWLLGFGAVDRLLRLGDDTVLGVRGFCRSAMVIFPFVPPFLYISLMILRQFLRQRFSRDRR